jgi:predicted nucleic acid-binding protein
MIYLFDTNAISDYMRQHPTFDERLAGLGPEDRVATSVIARGEILFGIERMPLGKRRDELSAQAVRVLAALPCEPLLPGAADRYAGLKNVQQKTGLPLDENDLWIAASALILGAVLVTRDSDFRRIPGVHAQDWTA